jgi:hypothetical protein
MSTHAAGSLRIAAGYKAAATCLYFLIDGKEQDNDAGAPAPQPLHLHACNNLGCFILDGFE